jgi:cytochrome P450
MIALPSAVDDELTPLLEARADAIADPYSIFRRLRETKPVYRRSESEIVLTRYRDIHAVQIDAAVYSNDIYRREADRWEARIAGHFTPTEADLVGEVRAWEAKQMSRLDDPEHARLRRIAHRAFTPKRVADLRSDIERMTVSLLQPLADRRADLVEEFASALPLLVIFELLGVPAEARESVRQWSAAMVRFRAQANSNTLAAAIDGLRGFRAFAEEHIDKTKNGNGGSDLMSALLTAQEGESLRVDEFVMMIVLLLLGGHETTMMLIGNGVLQLLRHPDQWTALRDDGSLVPNAVEEMLRYDAPAPIFGRVATTETMIADVAVHEGDHILLLLGAGNRDPEQCADPDRFDIRRENVRHLSLGYGPHFCLGASLARLEGEVVFSTLARRFPGMRLVDEEIEWMPSPRRRGPIHLHVEMGPDTGARAGRGR